MIKKTFDASSYKKAQVNKAYSGHTSVAAEGGETIPTPLADYFMELLRDGTVLRQLFQEIPMTALTLEIPKMTAGNTMYFAGEGLDMATEGGASGSGSSISRTTWSSVTLTNYKLGVLTGYTTELAEDSLIDIGRMVVEQGALAMAAGEEQAWIWGDARGDFYTYTAGQPELKYNGLISETPGTGYPTGATMNDVAPDNVIDGASDLLTFNELNDLLSRIEDQAGNGKVDTLLVPPKVIARMRNPVEFEMFQSIDKIGADKAALLKGQVGDYYGAKIISSGFLPVGTDTAPANADAGSGFLSGTTDTMILGFDNRCATIGQRRAIEIRSRHKFYNDLEEVRFLERVAFQVMRNEWLGGIFDVKNSAV